LESYTNFSKEASKSAASTEAHIKSSKKGQQNSILAALSQIGGGNITSSTMKHVPIGRPSDGKTIPSSPVRSQGLMGLKSTRTSTSKK
jgi:hypothetical protein